MPIPRLIHESLTRSVIGAFYEVYNALGYGFFEHVYLAALERELVARGHAVARESNVYVTYKGIDIATQRIDMFVDEKLIVEAKSAERLPDTARRQLLSYLHSTNVEVGLLLHFGPNPAFIRLVNTRKTRISAESARSAASAFPKAEFHAQGTED